MAIRRNLSLLGVGLVSAVVYLAVTVRLPWWRYGRMLNSWSDILGHDWGTFALCLTGVAVLLLAYLWGWHAVREGLVPRWMIWGGAILYAITLFWLLPITADLFLYLVRAHVFTDLGANPLRVAPVALPRDPVLASYVIDYESRPTVYGPAWTLLSAPGTMGRYDIISGLFYLKGLAMAAYLGCAWLLERILRQVRPGSAQEGLYLFAWNPLVLLMGVGDGHNDIVMMVLVLLAGWWLLQERWALALGTLALSVWVKYVSVMLFPLFIIYIWWRLAPQGRRRLTVLSRGILVAAGVSTLVVAPFWYPDLLPGLVERLAHPISSEMPALSQWALGIGLALFVLGYAVALGWIARGPRSLSTLIDASVLVTLLILLLGAARSQPWHLIWPAALAGLSNRRWVWPLIITAAAMMLAGQVWIEWGTPGLDMLF
jgi:hypothetical protein